MPSVPLSTRVPDFVADAIRDEAKRSSGSVSDVIAVILTAHYDGLEDLAPTGIQAARERAAKIDADTKALRLRWLQGELVEKEACRLVVKESIAVIRGRANALPRAIPHLPPADIAVLEKEVADFFADIRGLKAEDWDALRKGTTWEEIQHRFHRESGTGKESQHEAPN